MTLPTNLQPLPRKFLFNGATLGDPNPNYSIEEVRNHFAGTYADINNASYEEEITEKAHVIRFTTAVGSKG